jgi:hypothetical protein
MPLTRLIRQAPSDRSALRLALGAAATGAGVIHLAVAPAHLTEYVPLGIGFVAAGVLQIGWGVAIALRDSRRLLYVGAAGSLLFLGVYVLSRTVGLPFGPEAFEPEAFGAADLLCCALEVPVALGAYVLARRPTALRGRLRASLAAAVAAAFVLTGSATAYAATVPAHEHQHEHATCPSAPVLSGVLDARGVDTGVTAFFTCKLQHSHDASHG